jgi:hypothetical protein
MIVGELEARRKPRGEQLNRCFNSGRPLVLLAILRFGWKCLPRTNTIAYYVHSQITVVNSFVALTPGVDVIKLFVRSNLRIFCTKLE